MNPKLIVVGGDVKTKEINLKLPTVIGRGRNVTLALPHALVSRRHCEIFEKHGKLFVRDLGSLNGTFVNNVRIEAEYALEPEQLLTIGSVTFRAVYQFNPHLENRETKYDPLSQRETVGADSRDTDAIQWESQSEKVEDAENLEEAESVEDSVEAQTPEQPPKPRSNPRPVAIDVMETITLDPQPGHVDEGIESGVAAPHLLSGNDAPAELAATASTDSSDREVYDYDEPRSESDSISSSALDQLPQNKQAGASFIEQFKGDQS